MSTITLNGALDYPEQKQIIIDCAKSLSEIANGDSGHLADVVSGIRTNISLLELVCTRLYSEFNSQKDNFYNSIRNP